MLNHKDKNGRPYSPVYLKTVHNQYDICILIVHHTRKQPAGDNLEMISGITRDYWGRMVRF